MSSFLDRFRQLTCVMHMAYVRNELLLCNSLELTMHYASFPNRGFWGESPENPLGLPG